MHLKAKRAAFGGLLLAMTVIFMFLGSVIETNTLFLLAAASFFVGVVFREFGQMTGLAFYLSAVLLGFLLGMVPYTLCYYFCRNGILYLGKRIYLENPGAFCRSKAENAVVSAGKSYPF